ncbi:helix-turn-helix domain-containing protein [Oxyplasma meridianum]|uniref:Helix-turn-helix domain-containing protein n=1 Tax=Oxyplasma meridianum TaxID=3073602 RepID=A0AAX4NI65_9ARCH
MYEVEFLLKNSYPFCAVSEKFPDVTFYRWCNSSIDYLEFYGQNSDIEKILNLIPEIENILHTTAIYKLRNGPQLTVMLACRCSIENSTIRMAESSNCLWQAPVEYKKGREYLHVISIRDEYLSSLYENLVKIGDAEILKKSTFSPNSLRDTYTISISSLFENMTAKQITYFTDALYSGYYSIPKRVTIQELAGRYHLSESTMEEHLNKAKTKILHSLKPYISLFRKQQETNNK